MIKLKDILNEHGTNMPSAQTQPTAPVVQQPLNLTTDPGNVPKLSKAEKSELLEKVHNFNTYYESICAKNMKVMETANHLKRIAGLAERFVQTEVLNEENWMEARNAEKHIKELRKISENFESVSKDCYERMRQLEIQFDDAGRLLERYFKIN